jgi:hypothetical protein
MSLNADSNTPPSFINFSVDGLGDVKVCAHGALHRAVLRGDAGSRGDETGLMTWPGARALCRAMIAHRALLADAIIVELGTGTGVCGALAAARCSPCRIVLTDASISALELAEKTLDLNLSGVQRCRALVCRFEWGADAPSEVIAACGGRCNVLCAAECIYPSSSNESLVSFFAAARALTREDGTIIFSYVPRRADTTIRLCATIWRSGFSMSLWEGTVDQAVAQESGAVVLLLRFTGAPETASNLLEELRAISAATEGTLPASLVQDTAFIALVSSAFPTVIGDFFEFHQQVKDAEIELASSNEAFPG